MTTRGSNSARGIVLASIAVAAVLAESSLAQSGGGYEVSAQVVAAGRTSASGSGGQSIAATVAQPDAASASGGAYTLSGGFWPVAVNPPPADALFGNGFE